MSFIIRGKMRGDKEVVNALNKAPRIFFFNLRKWMVNEGANMIGGKDSNGKTRKGYRDILANIPRRGGRGGKWAKSVAHQFNFAIPYAHTLDKLNLKMGLLSNKPHQIQRAIEKLAEGGSISSPRKMPVPLFRNIRAAGYSGGMSMGSVRTGMKSKAFKFFSNSDRMVPVEDGDVTLWFDKNARKKRGDGFKKSGLLFMGLRGIRQRNVLTGRRNFFARWERMQGTAILRGQTAVDRAVRTVEREK